MPTYQCNTCQKIEMFNEKYEYEVKDKACPKCKKVGTFKSYSGPMAESILSSEDAKSERLKNELKATLVKLDTATAELDKIGKDKEAKQREYERTKTATPEEIAAFKDQIEKFNKDMIAKSTEIDELRSKAAALDDEIDTLGNREAVHKDSPKAFDSATNVEKTSGKNKLYIGSRQYVSKYAEATKAKKKRILDVPNWSPGLNVSWVEGGIAAKAHFKIKINPENQYHTIPDQVMQKFKDSPNMDPSDFLKLCKTEGKDSLLWYNKDGKERPTWTALEIWCLLRAGYTFTFADSAKDVSGKKIVLVPPA